MPHHIKSKYFPSLLIASALIVELSAIFFSVYGLTKLFAGAAISVGVMAVSLEFAKVISVSFLYRYWDGLKKLYKTYMVTSAVILMLITSMGIYGFLSNAFQGSTLGFEKDIAKLSLQEDEISRIKEDNVSLKSEKDDLRNSMNSELNGLIIKEESRYTDVNKRTSVSRRYQTLIKEKDKQLTENNKKIESLTKEITDSKLKMIDSGADVGPIIFVSKALNTDVSTIVQYLILLFIIVFDPLALALLIAFNKITLENLNSDSEDSELNEYKIEKYVEDIIDDLDKNPTEIKSEEKIETPKVSEPEIKNIPNPIHNMEKKYSEEEDGILYVDTSTEPKNTNLTNIVDVNSSEDGRARPRNF